MNYGILSVIMLIISVAHSSTTTTTTETAATQSHSSVSGDLSDYLEGNGNFSTPEVESLWHNTHEEDFKVTFVHSEHDIALQIERIAGEISFKDGFTYNIQDSQPGHVRFSFASSQKEVEAANFRLKDAKNDKTAVSFRCGYAGFVRVNDNQMVMFYNQSVSTEEEIYWTKADILLDWVDKTVQIFMNETYQGSANFYHEDVATVNQVLIYNLHPETTSWWKNVQVCKSRCANFNFGYLLQALTIVLMIAMLQ